MLDGTAKTKSVSGPVNAWGYAGLGSHTHAHWSNILNSWGLSHRATHKQLATTALHCLEGGEAGKLHSRTHTQQTV